MQVAICGLGRMGAGMARRAARGGHEVVAWNRTEAVATEIANEAENEGRIAVAEPIERLVGMMASPRHVVISVPSGAATDDMINQLATILEPGDVISTGTPEGVGHGRVPPVYLADGDVVEVEVEGIGVLRNRCAVVG